MPSGRLSRMLMHEPMRLIPNTTSQGPPANLASCLRAAPSPPPPPSRRSSAYPSNAVHVALVDNRLTPELARMIALLEQARALEAPGAPPLVAHLVVNEALPAATRALVPSKAGYHVHPVLGPRALVRAGGVTRCLYRGLARTCRGRACLGYLYKTLLHRLLPPTLERLMVLDLDLVVVRPLSQLWAEFGGFLSDAVIGLAREQNHIYEPLPAFNGGVQLLHLARMRAQPLYESMLDWHASGRSRARTGAFGDQTVYTLIAYQHPLLVYRLGCEWNRQLSFIEPREYAHCGASCGILHTNYGQRALAGALQREGGACRAWNALLQGRTVNNVTMHGRVRRFVQAMRMSECCVVAH